MLTREQLFTLAAVTLLATVFIGGVGWAIAAGDSYETPAERMPDNSTQTDACPDPSWEINASENESAVTADQVCSTPTATPTPSENSTDTSPDTDGDGQ